jgi:Zn-dependent membrane protease YugP
MDLDDMTTEEFDQKMKKNLILTYVVSGICVIAIVLGVIFIATNIGPSSLPIIFFSVAFVFSMLGLFFEYRRKTNLKYKQLTQGIGLGKDEYTEDDKFRDETEATLDEKYKDYVKFKQVLERYTIQLIK